MAVCLRIFLWLAFGFSALSGYSQKEAAVWYFGGYAGVDFNSGSPVIIHGGKTHAMEGVATISNKQGQLLFYTDGNTLWNKQHQVMPNGTGLIGHYSSTQTGVIVPLIGDTNRYYVFTIDAYENLTGLHYSIVNMTLDSGRGAVETKNVPLISNVSEKLTAVRHCNQRDIWVITHSTFGDLYHAFLVDPSGVHPVPVTSNTGSSLSGNVVGYLKSSPDGKKLVAANWKVNLDVSDFNSITGVVSNTYSLFSPSSDTSLNVYGIEFSPNGRLLYATAVFFYDTLWLNIPYTIAGSMLLQYDLSLATPDAVRSSFNVIAKKRDDYGFHALQLAIDGRIYMVKSSNRQLSAINKPNTYGPGCTFKDSAVVFTYPENTYLGLPNFIQSFFFARDSFKYSAECPGNKVSFEKKPSGDGNTFKWIFGDPASGAANYSNIENPVHYYTTPGEHTVELITYSICGNDTIRRVIKTFDLAVELGPDTLMCTDQILELNAGGSGLYEYTWQDQSNLQTFLVNSPGTYSVEIRNILGCKLKDSIQVNYDDKPSFTLGSDQLICPGNVIQLQPNIDPSWQVQWQDGTTSPKHDFTEPGTYSLMAINFCGSSTDEIVIHPGICRVHVPNAFTPNRDGKNDLFKILGTEKVSHLHLIVFNRWGEKVFETRDKNKGWDGRFHGKEVPTGTYVYMLQFTDAYSPQVQNLKGNFVLIR
jgi:gliding motility-associated-like protein